MSTPNTVEGIVSKYPSVFSGVGKLKNFQVKIHIDPTVTPVIQPLRRLPYHTRAKVSEELDRLLKLDIIEPVEGPTPWINPVVVVPKSSGEIHLNEAIIRERFPIPTLDEVVQGMHGAKVFSKLDLKEGCHQLELEEHSREITTFSTHKGLFRYKTLIFGINTAFEVFQRMLQHSLSNCEGQNNISDDIIVYGYTQEEHDRNLERVLQRLNELNLTLKKEKCIFSVPKLVFSGFTLSGEGISPDVTKVDAVRNFKTPESVADVRSFLGLVNYCSRFIRDYSTLTDPLRDLTKKHTKWKWTTEHQDAFDKLKDALTSSEVLAFYNPNAETKLIVEASGVGLGAILCQKQDDDSFCPVSYASRALDDVEQRYSQTEHEALSVFYSCQKFHHYIYDMNIEIVTDHKPLLSLISVNSSPPPRIQKWLLKLQGYHFKLSYIEGHKNAADVLSRSPLRDSASSVKYSYGTGHFVDFIVTNAVPKALTLDEIISAVKDDAILTDVRQFITSGNWQKTELNKAYYSSREQLSVREDVILFGSRIVIPSSLRRHVLELAHEKHQGIVKTKALLLEKVWWQGMDSDVEKFIKECHPCQVISQQPIKYEPLHMTEIPTKCWQTVAMDLQGPYPTGDHLLTLIDYRSRYPVVIPMRTITAEKVIKELRTVFGYFGLPETLTTDNGPQFISTDFLWYLSNNQIRHRRVTPMWAKANGEVEHFHQALLKANQAAFVEGKDWRKELDNFLLAYRTTPHTVTGEVPADIFFGRSIRTKFQRIWCKTAWNERDGEKGSRKEAEDQKVCRSES